ncbi:hypothetical protein LZ31DRAFT_482999, partial [Colletotrichum somersetense]
INPLKIYIKAVNQVIRYLYSIYHLIISFSNVRVKNTFINITDALFRDNKDL